MGIIRQLLMVVFALLHCVSVMAKNNTNATVSGEGMKHLEGIGTPEVEVEYAFDQMDSEDVASQEISVENLGKFVGNIKLNSL